jgi:hypothetical protein
VRESDARIAQCGVTQLPRHSGRESILGKDLGLFANRRKPCCFRRQKNAVLFGKLSSQAIADGRLADEIDNFLGVWTLP